MPASRQTRATARFFDEVAEDYARRYAEETPAGYALRARREKVLKMFDQPGGKVVDVGCGPAVMTQELLNLGCEFWGVDASPKMIELSRKQFAENHRTHFVLGEATHLDFPNNFFDAALCMGVIDRVHDRRGAIREMLRVLKPCGTLIITFPNLYSPHAWWKKFVFLPGVALLQGLGDRLTDAAPRAASAAYWKDVKLYSARAACKLVSAQGAKISQLAGYYFNVFISPLDEIWPGAALRVTKKLEEGSWPRPEWIAAGFILKATKI